MIFRRSFGQPWGGWGGEGQLQDWYLVGSLGDDSDVNIATKDPGSSPTEMGRP